MNAVFKIAITICLLVGSLFTLDFFYTSFLHTNKNTKADFVTSSKIDADILIHGPCEPLWMVNPAQLDSLTGITSYNLALSHSDFADNYLHLYLYLKNNKAPKLILLYVTPESMDKNFNTFNSYRFAQYSNDDTVAEVVKECDPNYSEIMKVPFVKYTYYNKLIGFNAFQGLKHKIESKNAPFFPNGFEPPSKIKWDNHLEDMITQYPNGYRFLVDSLRVKYLNKLIDLAKNRGVKIVLYESPVLSESLNNLLNRDQVLDDIKNIAERKNVEYVVFKDPKLSASRDNYISSLNLNSKGLRVFNDSLARFIKIQFAN